MARWKKRLSLGLVCTITAMIFLSNFCMQGLYAAEKTSVTVWVWGEASWAIKEEIKPTFESKYPNITINRVEMGPWDLLDKLLTSMVTGRGLPDVSEMVRRVFPPYALSGLIMDLTEKAAKYKDDFTPGSMAEVTFNGRIYAMPTETSYSTYIYQRSRLV